MYRCPRCDSQKIVAVLGERGRQGLCLTCQMRWFQKRAGRPWSTYGPASPQGRPARPA